LLGADDFLDTFTDRANPDIGFNQAFKDELFDRCIRPVVLETGENAAVSVGSPLPYGMRCDNAQIELAPPNSTVTLTATCIDRTLSLSAVITDPARRQTTRSWTFSSTFVIQGDFYAGVA
jgi:hypothetical protein